MDKYGNVAVIIPALNEGMTVGPIVTEVRSFGCDVYVVDDCSSDDTKSQALGAGAEVLSMPVATGAWGAIQAGLLYAMKQGQYDFFFTMDADGQHESEYIPLLMESIKSVDVNVVIGSFPQRAGKFRQFAWRFFSFVTQLKIRDMTSGFKLYDGAAAKAVLCKEAAMFDYQDLGVLLLLRRKQIRCLEVPVSMAARKNGYSRVFNSWFSVFIYVVKTCTCVFVDWFAGPNDSSDDWTDYDAI